MTNEQALNHLSTLVDAVGGIANEVLTLAPSCRVAERFRMFGTACSNIGFIAPETMGSALGAREEDPVGGAGSDLEEDIARIRSYAECMERYANFIFSKDEIRVDTAEALGDDAMGLDLLPICSDEEYAHPKAPNIRPPKGERIRWISALELLTGKRKFVPLVCSHLVHRPWRSELFTNSISTGVAAHFAPERAVLSALCEVIERDAIATLWLGRIPFPRFEPPPELLVAWGLDQETAIRTLFFDATTDCGARTVYILQLCDNHPHAAQIVGCATDVSLRDACKKVVRETLCYRTKFEQGVPVSSNYESFFKLQDGAAYMGRPEQREAFRFLIDTPAIPMPDDGPLPAGDKERLRLVTDAVAAAGMDIYLVDLTTDELRDIGLWVVRAIVPQLMPMSPVYRARFLGHPRLIDIARRYGKPDFTLADVNPFPQPFA